MWTIIASAVLPTVVAFVLDRVKYARDIAKHADAVVKVLPEGSTAREIAEQAVIAANEVEIQRQVKLLREQEAKSAAQAAQWAKLRKGE